MNLGNLSFLERFYVNSFFRRCWHQPRVARWLFRHAPLAHGADILEIGCGRGYGLLLIQQHYAPHHLTGLEIDHQQLTLAKQRWGEEKSVTLKQGDATHMPFKDKSFHACFSFGALHHIPQWEHTLAEAARVLKDGGYLLLEEYYRPFLTFPLLRHLMAHPPQRFTHGELIAALQHHGFRLVASRHTVPGMCGVIVAQKRPV